MGYTIKCDKCNYEFELLNDYGGIYDWETYLCQDCKRYFSIKTIDGKLVESKLRTTLSKFFKANPDKNPMSRLRCKFCKSKDVKRVYDEDIVDFTDFKFDEFNKTLIKCPVCNSKMHASCMDFDD